MNHEIEFAYVELQVADPHGLTKIFTETVGMMTGDPAFGDTSLRNDERTHRIIVTQGALDDCAAIAFEAVDASAFEAVSKRLAAAGFPLQDANVEETALRGVQRLRTVDSPWRMKFELVLGLPKASTDFVSTLVPGGFQTSGVGAGHVAIAVMDFDESERFLFDGLNMVQSDWVETEIMEGVELEVRFYHCNERHHSIALAKVPFDLGKNLHHIQVECNDRDDVGSAFDRAWKAGLDFANGLGLHDNEGAFSFYVTSPAGFLVEVGHGTKKVYAPWDGNRRYDAISRWGHQPIPAAGRL